MHKPQKKNRLITVISRKLLYIQIAAQHFQGVVNTVDMAALVTVAGIDTGADETVADIIAGGQSGLHIGAIVGIHIHSIVRLRLLGCFNELAHHIVAVRTAGVLAADGDLPLGAVKAVAYAAHIHGNRLGDTCGDGSGTTVTHFFIHRDVGIYPALENSLCVG